VLKFTKKDLDGPVYVDPRKVFAVMGVPGSTMIIAEGNSGVNVYEGVESVVAAIEAALAPTHTDCSTLPWFHGDPQVYPLSTTHVRDAQ
jgi:hypothetical protein